MVQVNFDPTKPASGQRFRSEEVRENFQSLSRANDLRCSEQATPDLTIRVEAGAYAITSNETKFFAGGSTLESQMLGALSGGGTGPPAQTRIIVLELDSTGALLFNTSGTWVTPPTVPVAPNYTSDRIPLCEIVIFADDTVITNDRITDVRPMINLGASGATGGLVSPGVATSLADELGPLGLGPGNGQATFKTTSSFTYLPGQDEVLVYSGGVYQTVDEDYTETDSETITFLTARPDGERVTIWKVGLSATPGSIGLADLSDVDGNEAAAFNNADSPTAINPFLTTSGHAAIDHSTLPSLAPFAAHLVTTATNAANRHHASEIEATDNFAFSNATEVQGVLDDIETNIYQEFLDEHNADGTHGPTVSITQPSDANALRIIHSSPGPDTVPAISITKNGTGNADVINISNTAGLGRSISITHGGTNHALNITHSGTAGAGIAVDVTDPTNSTDGMDIDYWGTGIALDVDMQAGGNATTGIQIDNDAAGSSWSLRIDHDVVSGVGARIEMSSASTGPGVSILHSGDPSTAAMEVLVTNAGAANPTGIEVDMGGDGACLLLNRTAAGGGQPVIDIVNSGLGADIRGHQSNWFVDSLGNANFADVEVGGGSTPASSFLILKPVTAVPTFPCDAVNGRDTSISVTGTWTRILTATFAGAGHTVVDISRIETSGIQDGTLVLFTWGDRGGAGGTTRPRFVDNNSDDGVCVTGNLAMSVSSFDLGTNSTWDNNIWFMKDGSEWIQVQGQVVNIS